MLYMKVGKLKYKVNIEAKMETKKFMCGFHWLYKTFCKRICKIKIASTQIIWMQIVQIMKIIYPKFISQLSPLTFTCSKSTIETLEKGVKYVQS